MSDMKISREVKEAVDRVFTKRGYTEDKVYVGSILPDELREAAELVGNVKLEISLHEKARKAG